MATTNETSGLPHHDSNMTVHTNEAGSEKDPSSELPEPVSGERGHTSDHKLNGNGDTTSNHDHAGSDGEDGQEGSTAGKVTGAVKQVSEKPPEFASTPNDSSENECENGYFSDTSEMSQGQQIKFELRRAEIRRGKARESSPVPSDALVGALSRPRLTHEIRGNEPAVTPDEAPLPMLGGSRDLEKPDVMYTPWERDPERPPQKLPIRFRDLNGRTYLLPWQKVRTWNRAKELIKRIHEHQPRVLTMINYGEYHLLVKEAWANEEDATIGPSLISYPQLPIPERTAVPNSPTPNPLDPPNNPMIGGRKNIPHTRDAIVLPETWDAVVEPGMYVDMVAWHSGPHPVFGLVPPQFGHGRGWAILPPPPPHIAHLVDEGLPNQGLTMSQATGTMALASGNWPPRPHGQGRAATAPAPRKVVKTRVRPRC